MTNWSNARRAFCENKLRDTEAIGRSDITKTFENDFNKSEKRSTVKQDNM